MKHARHELRGKKQLLSVGRYTEIKNIRPPVHHKYISCWLWKSHRCRHSPPPLTSELSVCADVSVYGVSKCFFTTPRHIKLCSFLDKDVCSTVTYYRALHIKALNTTFTTRLGNGSVFGPRVCEVKWIKCRRNKEPKAQTDYDFIVVKDKMKEY